jgi:hypothetical protein
VIRARIGLVQQGAGGSAASYKFDPATGLSNDPALAYYLQDLTPAQLQTALNGQSPTADLMAVNNAIMTGAGLPCGTTESGDADCNGGAATGSGFLSSIPVWAWIGGAGLAVFLVMKR